MTIRKKAFCLTTIFHLLLFLILLFWRTNKPESEIVLYYDLSKPTPVIPESENLEKKVLPEPQKTILTDPEPILPEPGQTLVVNTKLDSTKQTPKADKKPLKERLFLSTPLFLTQNLDKPKELLEPTKEHIPTVNPHAMDGLAISNGESIFAKLKPDPKPGKVDWIPSKTELEALNIIWQNGMTSDHDIYTKIDTSLRITAAQFNRTLKNLADKNILSRKMVSARNEFQVGLLIIPIAKIEKDPKNRRNRVYAYEALVDRNDVKNFLDAELYKLKNGIKSKLTANMDSLSAHNLLTNHISRLTGVVY